MKRIFLLFAAVLLSLCACAAPAAQDAVYVPPEERLNHVTIPVPPTAQLRAGNGEEMFQFQIPEADAIVQVKYIGQVQDDTGVPAWPTQSNTRVGSSTKHVSKEYRFAVQQCLKGSVAEKEITVVATALETDPVFYDFKYLYSYILLIEDADLVYEGALYALMGTYFLIGNNNTIQDYEVRYMDRNTYEIPVKNVGQLKKYIRKYNDKSELKENGPTIGKGYVNLGKP